MDLTRVKGVRNGKVISDQIQDVAVRVKVIRPMAAEMATLMLEEGTLASEVCNPQINNFNFFFCLTVLEPYRQWNGWGTLCGGVDRGRVHRDLL